MPDKRYKRGDGRRCLGCWINKMKHGNKLKGPKSQEFYIEDKNEIGPCSKELYVERTSLYSKVNSFFHSTKTNLNEQTYDNFVSWCKEQQHRNEKQIPNEQKFQMMIRNVYNEDIYKDEAIHDFYKGLGYIPEDYNEISKLFQEYTKFETKYNLERGLIQCHESKKWFC